MDLQSQHTSEQTDAIQSKGWKQEPPRWAKRILLILVACGVGGTVAASLTARPEDQKPIRLARGDRESARIQETIQKIDAEFSQSHHTASLLTTPPADTMIICRRLSLALVGCGLSLEDYRWLEKIPEASRVSLWLETLLDDPRCHDYLAERMTRAFVGTNDGPFLLFRRRKFTLWLADELRKKTPYDSIVRQLIAANGLWTDQPSVNFLTATMDENRNGRVDPIRLAGRTSRAFLGMRIDCLHCHDDFLGNVKLGEIDQPREGTQRDFHQLAAFYAGASLPEKNVFAGIRDDNSPYQFKFLGSEEETIVEANVPFGRSWLPDQGSPRQRLAAWVTHSDNEVFARATVNRFWAFLFGQPLVSPVDDIPLQGPYPPGLQTLAEDCIEHHYDLRRLIRIIAGLKAFQSDSRSEEFEITEAHEQAWAVFPLTQLRPEQVAASIHQACRLKTVDEKSAILSKLEKFGYVNNFTKGFGDRGEDEFISQSVTVSQRLLMMNGGLVQERTKRDPVMNASTRIGFLAMNDSQAIETAYLSVLNRMPSSEEKQVLSELLSGKRGDARGNAMSDIYWMLINSTEFSWNH